MGFIDGANVIVNDCLAVRKRETVLIISDLEYKNISSVIHEVASESSNEVFMLTMNPRKKHQDDLPRSIREAMKHVDVIIAPTLYSFSHTPALKVALRRGARVATMPGVVSQSFSTGGITADYRKIDKDISKIFKKIRRTREAHVTCDLGTDIILDLSRREWIPYDNGLCRKKGQFTNLPAGELFIPPVEMKAQGRVVVDGSMNAQKLEKPIRINIEDGQVKTLIGNTEIRDFVFKQGKAGRSLARLGFGINPNAKVYGSILEDRKTLGSINMAFGDNSRIGGRIQSPINIDAVLVKANLELDGKMVVEQGQLVI